jgi:hypothetical protein
MLNRVSIASTLDADDRKAQRLLGPLSMNSVGIEV